MKVNVVMGNTKRTMDRIFNNSTGIFVAETCARYMNPYVPMDKGNLSQIYTTEPYKVIYESIYAEPNYEGKNRKFSKLQHPQATSYWDKACMSAKRKQIAREITQYKKKG